MMGRARRLWKELFMEEKKIITLGDVLDLVDQNREMLTPIAIHAVDGTTLRGPMCSELWGAFDDIVVCQIHPDGGSLEIWLQEADDGEV